MPFPLTVIRVIVNRSELWAECILIVVNLLHLVRFLVPQYTRYIKPQILIDSVMFDIGISGNGHEPAFMFIHVLLRADIAVGSCACLDFYKHKVGFVFGNDVNLYVPEPPVTLHNLVAVFGQILACGILAKVTYFVMECHVGYLLRLRMNRFFCSPSAGAAAMSARASCSVMCSTSVDLGMR